MPSNKKLVFCLIFRPYLSNHLFHLFNEYLIIHALYIFRKCRCWEWHLSFTEGISRSESHHSALHTLQFSCYWLLELDRLQLSNLQLQRMVNTLGSCKTRNVWKWGQQLQLLTALKPSENYSTLKMHNNHTVSKSHGFLSIMMYVTWFTSAACESLHVTACILLDEVCTNSTCHVIWLCNGLKQISISDYHLLLT